MAEHAPRRSEGAARKAAPRAEAEAKPGEVDIELQTENLIDTYHVLSEWIRFADAKAAVVLTVGGAVAGLMIPTLKPFLNADSSTHPVTWWPNVGVGLFALWLIILVASFIAAFRCVLPYRRKGEHPARNSCPHFHAVGVTAKYGLDESDRFVAGFREAGAVGFQKEVLAGILIDAHISAAKYSRVTSSIKLFALSAVFALLYLVVIQF